MLALTLDGRKALLKKGTSFKFTVENPAFSDKGEYSFEVALPVAGCRENLLIFGSIIRPEQPCGRPTGSFTLLSPHLSTAGTYTVTEVTDTEVKVQLLAKRSEANFNATDAKGNELYIDEMELGKCWDGEWEEMDRDAYDYAPGEGGIGDTPTLDEAAWYFTNVHTPLRDRLAHGGAEGTSCWLFPVAPAAGDAFDGTRFNGANYHRVYHLNGKALFVPDFGHKDAGATSVRRSGRLAPQPGLLDVLRRVLAAVGYVLDTKACGLFFRNVMVVGCRFGIDIADLLPHWTVGEFFTEVCNFFGVVILFNDDGTAAVVKRADYYAASTEALQDVADGFTLNREEESQEEHSGTGNVDYEWPVADDMLRLPDEVWERANVKRFADLAALNAFAANLEPEEREQSDLLLCDDGEGTAWAFLQAGGSGEWRLTRLDFFPPLLRDEGTRDIKTKLRIVPARMKELQWPYVTNGRLPVLLSAGTFHSESFFSVNNAVNPDSDAASENTAVDKPDVMEVAFSGGGDVSFRFNEASGSSANFNVPLGVLVQRDETTNLPVYVTNFAFRDQSWQFPKEGPFRLDYLAKDGEYGIKALIDTSTAYEFDFFSNVAPDINSAFLIRGARYVAAKLEYTLSADSHSTLIHGSFYRLN